MIHEPYSVRYTEKYRRDNCPPSTNFKKVAMTLKIFHSR